MLAFLSVALASCYTVSEYNDPKNDIDVLDKVRSLDLLPRYPKQIGNADQPLGKPMRPAVYEGAETSDAADRGRSSGPNSQPGAAQAGAQKVGDGFELNFEGTPIGTVAKVVLGDIMQTGYTIDPRVQGTVTLASVRPVPKKDILFVLESALRLNGVILIHDSTGYHLLPLGDAVGSGSVAANGSHEAGYGISVVPLQYVSSQTLLKLLDSFALKPGTVRADARRNLLLVQGTGPERSTAIESIMSFDADWMHGQSVGIFPVTNGNPEPIVAELEKIMDSGENGLGHDVVKFQIISRMNAIMVVTPKAEVMHIAETWIKRLDSASADKNSVHVYHVKYGEARQLGRVLTDMFIGGSSSGTSDASTNPLAPGTGSLSSTSGSSLGAGGQSQTASSFGSQQNSGGTSSLVANRGFGGTPASGSTGSSASGSTSGSTTDLRSGSSGSNKPILDGVRITPDTVNNTLLIYADRQNYRIIESTLQQLDRPQLQVAIDATVAEVTLNDTLNYGVQTFLTSKNLGLKPDTGSIYNSSVASSSSSSTTSTSTSTAGNVISAVAATAIGRALPGFNFLIGSEANPSVILDALHDYTDVKVLSNPSLVVIDNQVATLQVGDAVPISTGSAIAASSTVVNTTDYRNTGIILRVAPRVNANGNVRLDVEQEISNVASASSTNTPTISQRTIKSSISVASGQTVLLAGLITETKNGERSGIPLLEDIPNMGDAFAHTSKTGQRTELIIFIRPQIIRDGADAHFVAEELRSKLGGTLSPKPVAARDARVQ
ncbi:MAG: type II secretion system secretin GspD [Xanthobacteraceae bacterium]|nr:type II secretion system secretin GspD [Xanthobacteraceae bacterium]